VSLLTLKDGAMEPKDVHVRIVRVLEYEYESFEAAAEDRDRWTNSINVPHMKMRSTSLPATVTLPKEPTANALCGATDPDLEHLELDNPPCSLPKGHPGKKHEAYDDVRILLNEWKEVLPPEAYDD
jgi:hypothetical protein